MARTAERYLKHSVIMAETPKKYHVGNYLRLSVDSDYTGSDSLENQRKLAQEYVSRHQELKLVREYVDDGKTGTNFLRPAFGRMMADVKAGMIDCIIVKDLSRFGREYIEAGNYIEKVFPFLGVRFISIVDGYDSADADYSREFLLISLKNLMHEMYARDISKKVGTTFRLKQEEKVFYRTSTIPYGYQMNDEGTNYIVCKQSAQIVQEIFRQYSRGVSKYAIIQWLYENHVQTPQQYRRTGNVYRQSEEEGKVWHNSTIKRILQNPVYIGTVIRHKSEQSFFEGKKSSAVPESEQVIIENNHEPLIDRHIFQLVQEKLNQSGEKRTESSFEQEAVIFDKNVFAGKLFCGSCKASMIRISAYRYVNGVKVMYKVFKCSANRNYKGLCDTRGIAEEVLCDILYSTIRKQLGFIKAIKKRVEKDIKYSFGENLKKTEWQKQKILNEKNLLEQEYLQKYSEYVREEIQQTLFLEYKNTYQEKLRLYDQQEKAYDKEIKRIKKCRSALQKLVSDWLCFQNTRKLTETMIEICIDRIDVFEDNRIEIKLKYEDCFQLLKNWTGGDKTV